MSSKVRDKLEAEGKDSSLGAVVGIVSTQVSDRDFSVFVCLPLLFSYMYITQRSLHLQWKALSETEKVPYNECAKKDRERYNKECAERDQEMLQQQQFAIQE